MGKLTGPQRSLLFDVSEQPRYVASSYPPARKLVEYGLATWEPRQGADYLQITDAGRSALQQGSK